MKRTNDGGSLCIVCQQIVSLRTWFFLYKNLFCVQNILDALDIASLFGLIGIFIYIYMYIVHMYKCDVRWPDQKSILLMCPLQMHKCETWLKMNEHSSLGPTIFKSCIVTFSWKTLNNQMRISFFSFQSTITRSLSVANLLEIVDSSVRILYETLYKSIDVNISTGAW